MRKILIIALLIPLVSWSQTLSSARMDRLKKSVVRIIIDTTASGTGFFISKEGVLVSCHHVIQSALYRKAKDTIWSFKPIYAEFLTGERVELKVMPEHLYANQYDALKYDYVLLSLYTTPKSEFKILKVGKWKNLEEGNVVYTAGYPLGIGHPFVSVGTASTKYIENRYRHSNGVIKEFYKRESALLDLTINGGNSGGPLIRKAKFLGKDKVVGIISFQLIPLGKTSTDLAKFFNDRTANLKANEINTEKALSMLFGAVSQASNGIGAGISIDYLAKKHLQ